MEKTMLELETMMWQAASSGDWDSFSRLVDDHAVLVSGGSRYTPREYAAHIGGYELCSFEITDFSVVHTDVNTVQTVYRLNLAVTIIEEGDLTANFSMTSTWAKKNDDWRMVFSLGVCDFRRIRT